MVVSQTYYYLSEILRAGIRVPRQGTVHAADPLDAIDKVYEMGDKVWKRSVISITVTEPGTGKILAKSTIGDYYRNNKGTLETVIKESLSVDIKQDTGWINKFPKNNQSTAWSPAIFGTYYRPPTFGRLVKFAE